MVRGHRSLVCHESTGQYFLVRGQLHKLIVYWLVAVSAVIVAFPAHSGLSSLQNHYFLVVWGYQGAGNPPRELICAWVAICGLEGRAAPFGDENSSIWIPTLSQHPRC